jgi:phage protein D
VSGKALAPVSISAGDVESWTLTAADRGKYAAVVAVRHDQAGNRKVEVRVGEAKGPAYRSRNEYPTEAAARAGANAKLASLKRGEATLTLNLAVGRPSAAAVAPLAVSGLHPDADGTWTIDKVTHTFDAQGLKSMVEADTK